MRSLSISTLVSTNWLREYLISSKSQATRHLRVLDTTFVKDQSVDSYTISYKKEHLPTALYFDLHRCVQSTPLIPRNVPDLKCFTSYVQQLGVWPDTHVIVYDRFGPSSSFRSWWLFRLFGHKKVSILDGGFNKWVKDGFEITTQEPIVEKSSFVPTLDRLLIRDYDEMVENCSRKLEQVLDARSPDSPTVKDKDSDGGWIPGSKHIVFEKLFNKDGTMKSEEELKQMFKEANVNVRAPMVASCFTGMTACAVAGAAHVLGEDIPVYYGSWTEWRQRAPENLKARARS